MTRIPSPAPLPARLPRVPAGAEETSPDGAHGWYYLSIFPRMAPGCAAWDEDDPDRDTGPATTTDQEPGT